MTLRPHIIRADTLDLQDHEAPSAVDHTHQPEHPGPLGSGPAAPHQEAALRHVSEDRHAEQEHLADVWGSGRSSHEGSDLLHDDMSGTTDDIKIDDPAPLHDDGAAPGAGDAEADDRLDDDIMDDRSSSPSIAEDEIDYDFVYALHNFVATVEGQANATKGDHMVLLDDTNSYWWLVRVVKDSSIGYLPAEHIETPNERLARLYKHRNIQSTQSILEDFQPKSKNPLKKAMRRRNAKTVQFTTPTYYEPSEADWSDAEGDSEREEELPSNETATKQNGQQIDEEDVTQDDAPQPNGHAVENADEPSESDNAKPVASGDARTALDTARPEQDSLEQEELTPNRSRNGTMRNTDSFFKDDTAEPRKMTLTPNILRDGSGDITARPSGSTDKPPSAQEVFEQMESGALAVDRSKDDRKKKDKKSGMLSGLFKRKERKIKVDEAAGGVAVKQEVDSGSPILTPGSGSGSPTGGYSPSSSSQLLPIQKPGSSGKVVKSPSPLNTPPNGIPISPINTTQTAQTAVAGGDRSVEAENSAATETDQTAEPKPLTIDTSVSSGNGAEQSQSKSLFYADSKREKLKTAKQRMDLDVESSPEEPPDAIEPVSGIPQDADEDSEDVRNRPISPLDDSSEAIASQPKLALDTSAQPRQSDSPPTPFDTTDSAEATSDGHLAPSAASSSRSVATAAESFSTASASPSPQSATTPPAADQSWNEGALRSYFEERSDSDIKDMLIRVHDRTGVVPLPLDHPKMLGLGFHESQKRLDEMSSQLDGLLNGFLARSAARPKIQQK